MRVAREEPEEGQDRARGQHSVRRRSAHFARVLETQDRGGTRAQLGAEKIEETNRGRRGQNREYSSQTVGGHGQNAIGVLEPRGKRNAGKASTAVG